MDEQGTLSILRVSWQTIEDCYNIIADLPGWDVVLRGVDLSSPEEAARAMFMNLLTEAMELVDRFNPWYKAPADAYGLRFASGWKLTPEAQAQWRPTLDTLARAVADCPELVEIQSATEATRWLNRPLIPATCLCEPPPIVWVPPNTVLDSVLVCEICGHRLHRVEQSV